MKLSVIIVNWNTAELTKNAIAAVFNETHGFDIEVILVDNNSADNSLALIKPLFPQVIYIENKDNLGFGKANNQGLKIARGEYIMFLNSDTVVLDGALNKLIAYLEAHPEVMMVGPRLLNGDMSFQHACRRNLPDIKSSFFHLFGLTKIFKTNKTINAYKKYADDPNVTEPVTGLSGAAMLFRRKVYETIGGFDEAFFMYGEDLDFCKRVFDQGWKTVYVSDAKIIHFGGGSSKKRRTKSLVNFYEAMWLYYKKHFAPNNLFVINGAIWFGIKARMGLALLANSIK